MFKLLSVIFLFICLTTSRASFSAGVSPYLPLNMDSLVELEIQRLVSITQLPNLTKPYPIVPIVKALNEVKDSHPILYSRINQYIKRYKKKSAITSFSAELSQSSDSDRILANKRGIPLERSLQASISSFYQYNKYLIVNGGGTFVSGEGLIPHNSFISVGYEYAQLDIGYREHWLSPSPISASLLSTNAEPILSLTLSNITPITDWNIKYELSYGQMSKTDGISFQGGTTSGKPGMLSMHLSIQPFDWWTIGANRTFMFGGGERSISIRDVWNAFIDPVNSDNCGSGETGCANADEEIGNQIASVTNKFDLSLFDFPFSLYFNYEGEDTKEHQNYQLGNIAYTYGVFLPYITADTSLYFEYSDFHDAWYTHHLYRDGYRNEGNVMGHWWANNRDINDSVGGVISTLKFNIDLNNESHLQAIVKSIKLDPSTNIVYKTANELELQYKQVFMSGFIGLSVIHGKDSLGESYSRAAINYSW